MIVQYINMTVYELVSQSIHLTYMCVVYGIFSFYLSLLTRPDIRFNVDNYIFLERVVSFLILLVPLLLAISTGIDTVHILYPGVFE